jgi:hypothetical protein
MSPSRWFITITAASLLCLFTINPIQAVKPATPLVNTDPAPISLDKDKDADFLDLQLILKTFNTSECKYKLQGSCLIDIFDYNLFLSRWPQ